MRRLVYTGTRFIAQGHNTREVIDNRFREHPAVMAAGLPGWFPKPAKPVYDPDEIRKQKIEDALAGGEGERA